MFLLLPMMPGTKGIDDEEASARMRKLTHGSMTGGDGQSAGVYLTLKAREDRGMIREVV